MVNKYFDNKFTALGEDVVDALQDALKDADTSEVAGVVAKVFEKYKVNKKFQDLFMGEINKIIDPSNPVKFERYYLKEVKCVDGVKLSSKINNVFRQSEISDIVKQAITTEAKIETAARALVDEGLVSGDLPKYMNKLITSVRQGANLTGDTDAYMTYKSQILRLKGAETKSQLARAYKDILSAKSGEVLDKAIERAILEKSRSNAERLARTEFQRAYGYERLNEFLNDEDCIGIEWIRAGAEGECEVCEELVGIYEKDNLPEYPAHPNCACLLEPVYQMRGREYEENTGDVFELPEGFDV